MFRPWHELKGMKLKEAEGTQLRYQHAKGKWDVVEAVPECPWDSLRDLDAPVTFP